ncbi:hypothetical protein DX928_13415 [Bacillus swezeyi]|uniref:Uncharacterized protein n=1 Tax=Bacillus swezeyi TaxID=1925020 RepID=A0A5M8RUJ5_9BACI|nr:hypothetical protein DX927_08035 [Bacillus swezeyi]KAA6475013.1 hypothetical protein DX928_13415 [Bacillus swezeyi]
MIKLRLSMKSRQPFLYSRELIINPVSFVLELGEKFALRHPLSFFAFRGFHKNEVKRQNKKGR